VQWINTLSDVYKIDYVSMNMDELQLPNRTWMNLTNERSQIQKFTLNDFLYMKYPE